MECTRHLLRRAVFTIHILTIYGLELLLFVILVICKTPNKKYVCIYSFFLSTPPTPPPPPSPSLLKEKLKNA